MIEPSLRYSQYESQPGRVEPRLYVIWVQHRKIFGDYIIKESEWVVFVTYTLDFCFPCFFPLDFAIAGNIGQHWMSGPKNSFNPWDNVSVIIINKIREFQRHKETAFNVHLFSTYSGWGTSAAPFYKQMKPMVDVTTVLRLPSQSVSEPGVQPSRNF